MAVSETKSATTVDDLLGVTGSWPLSHSTNNLLTATSIIIKVCVMVFVKGKQLELYLYGFKGEGVL